MKLATDFLITSLKSNLIFKEKFGDRIWDRNDIPENPKNPYMFLFLVSSKEKTELVTGHTSIFEEEYQLSIVCKGKEFGELTQIEIVKFINDEIILNDNVYDVSIIDLVPSEPRDNQGLLQYSVRIRIFSKIY